MNQSRPPRQVRRKISGVFLLNKPQGLTSNAALQRVRWLFRAEKAGHTGALDPMATGLLPVCLGEATKFSHFLLDADKTYRTSIRLGQATTTGDREGEVTETLPVPALNDGLIQHILQTFTGDQMQVPPMYSALKRDGQPLYKLAREGVSVEREPRPVCIHQLHLEGYDENTLHLLVSCSKGTYIRVLGEDIARALGTAGHLVALHRTCTGRYLLDENYTLDYLESLDEGARDTLLLPAFASVDHLPRIVFAAGEEQFFCRGNPVRVQTEMAGQALAFAGGQFLGLGLVDEQQYFYPKRLVNADSHEG